MTVFKTQIDPSQVILEWTTPAAFTIIILGGIVLALCSSITLPHHKKTDSDTENTTGITKNSRAKDIKDALVHAVVGTLCFIATLAVIVNPLSIDKFTQPAFDHTPGERVPLDFTQNDKQHIADLYRNDIDTAIDNKLSDYTIANNTKQHSILHSGKLEEPVLATKDGTTYTLTPHWDYDNSSHTAKLTVTVEEGDHKEDK